jgi:hypothetical protein
MFDVIPFLPDTNVREVINKQINNFSYENYSSNEVERRIGGMIKWVLNTTYQGNRNNNLFKLGSFILDLTNDLDLAQTEVINVNSMLSEPISDKELRNTVLKSLERRFNERN